MDKTEVLKECYVEGNNVKLPNIQMDRKLYLDVAKSLNLIGGKWKGGKVAAFVFKEDPTELLESIQNGDKRNLQKEYQFFETPPELADYLVELVEIKEDDLVLEPSAGQGAIIKAIHRFDEKKIVYCCEYMEVNRKILSKMGSTGEYANVSLLGEDYLKEDDMTGFYHKIIANPPFSKNQDIDHIYKMYNDLSEGGTLVSISSKHWKLSSNKKETAFRAWLEEKDAYIEEITEGTFKDSGTMVGGYIIKIIKE